MLKTRSLSKIKSIIKQRSFIKKIDPEYYYEKKEQKLKKMIAEEEEKAKKTNQGCFFLILQSPILAESFILDKKNFFEIV